MEIDPLRSLAVVPGASTGIEFFCNSVGADNAGQGIAVGDANPKLMRLSILRVRALAGVTPAHREMFWAPRCFAFPRGRGRSSENGDSATSANRLESAERGWGASLAKTARHLDWWSRAKHAFQMHPDLAVKGITFAALAALLVGNHVTGNLDHRHNDHLSRFTPRHVRITHLPDYATSLAARTHDEPHPWPLCNGLQIVG